jgi:hypothetical protein
VEFKQKFLRVKWLVGLVVSLSVGVSVFWAQMPSQALIQSTDQSPAQTLIPQVSLTSWNQGARYFTTGTVNTEGWHSIFRQTVLDFDSYQFWATRYLDGTHEFSRSDWVHFTRFYSPEPQTMVMVYDMNRWPLTGKNNRATFILQKSQESHQDRIVFHLRRPPLGLHGGQLALTMSPDLGLEFTLELHLWGVVSAFMNNDSFKRYMERLVGRMVQNMIEYVQETGSLDL